MPDPFFPVQVLFMAEPEGGIRCNNCDDYPWVDDEKAHARDVHGSDVFMVVHADDH